jgi:N-acetylmuramoyl-L-alanine amidase
VTFARVVRCFAAVLAVAVAFALPAGLSAAAAPTRAPARPAAPKAAPAGTVGLHELGRSLGFQVSWVDAGKKLRWKGRAGEIEFEADKREISLHGLRVFLGDAVVQGRRTLAISAIDRDRLLVPILAPRRLGPRRPPVVIALDAGHGGKDNGTTNRALALHEKRCTLDVVKRLRPLLEARGFKAVLTRTDDTFVALPDRPARAAAAGADLFVSVHFNATADGSVRGVETYTLTPQNQRSTGSDNGRAEDAVAAPGNACDGWNALLGFSMHRQVRSALGLSDRGLKRARFLVLRDTACPAVLVEGGYLSNKDEAKRIATPEYRQQLAAAIADAIVAYRDTLAAAARDRQAGRGSR